MFLSCNNWLYISLKIWYFVFENVTKVFCFIVKKRKFNYLNFFLHFMNFWILYFQLLFNFPEQSFFDWYMEEVLMLGPLDLSLLDFSSDTEVVSKLMFAPEPCCLDGLKGRITNAIFFQVTDPVAHENSQII